MIITISDMRGAGLCVKGLRKTAKDAGIDVRAVVKAGGIDSDVLVAAGFGGVVDIVQRSKSDGQ